MYIQLPYNYIGLDVHPITIQLHRTRYTSNYHTITAMTVVVRMDHIQ